MTLVLLAICRVCNCEGGCLRHFVEYVCSCNKEDMSSLHIRSVDGDLSEIPPDLSHSGCMYSDALEKWLRQSTIVCGFKGKDNA